MFDIASTLYKKTSLKPPTPKVRIPEPQQLVVPAAGIAATATDQAYYKEIDAHMKRMHVQQT
jgi:hypothetical protein